MFGGEKPFWKSKGVLAGVALVLLSLFGFEYNDDTMKMINENLENITGLILAGITIYGRIMATETVVVQPMVGTPANYTPAGPEVISAVPAGAPAAGLTMYTMPGMPVDELQPKG